MDVSVKMDGSVNPPGQDVSVVRLHEVLLLCRDDVSRGRNDDVSSVLLHDVSNKSQIKHPKTSQ